MNDTSQRTGEASGLSFYEDMHPPAADFRADILAGLSKPQKALPPKYYYDEEGSRLFDAITEQPEYYVTGTELDLLRAIGPELAALAGKGAVVLEPGAGSSVKIRTLLDALHSPAAYVGMDISGDHVRAACEALAADYPGLEIGALCHDFTQALDIDALPLSAEARAGRRVVFFPGSTIGNFELIDALGLLKTLRTWLRDGDALLIGTDMRKSSETLEAAYDDKAGVTAAFNLNLIARINRELDGNIDAEALQYRAFWNPYRSRVEMYLEALRDMHFTVAGKSFVIRKHETIHMENSHKFTLDTFHDLAAKAGLQSRKAWVSAHEPFSMHWLEPAGEAC
ncbi:MAG TPA: L-histidine N(alpha)-methyltransferase [Oceanicaulis sp.]|jgi:dimethylhistidine N-methyltransferase|uniref:Dimethylhistidine N-methyltransferase n=1 Tax=Glycocaulis albus TaxID=1382801 RepID=A0ABQ1XJD6_9PROT|nr:L-histidine N(alpha)-methyltransferase [Glycocaulis albus]MBV5259177.1 L-histidine N(alpha)-methyltransferase [Synechococcus moorigangaii CMS01]GGG95247.1 dimethylhistidine N-methyltransferase [Glycocaulis albus]HCY55782.1 L-histidine N(alpha)-methyltransferase [Oceanicaulis sp.]